jgi:hypothetical protein
MWSTLLFLTGRIYATPGVIDRLDSLAGEQRTRLVIRLLIRHMTGDWGEIDADDKAANDHAVILGGRVLSAYRLPDDTPVLVIPRPIGRPPRSSCLPSTSAASGNVCVVGGVTPSRRW